MSARPSVASPWLMAPALVLAAAVVSGCPSTVRPKPGSEDIEMIAAEDVTSEWKSNCRQVQEMTVRVGPDPVVEGSDDEPTDVQARNKAYRKGGSHVALGPAKYYPCNAFRNFCSDCDNTCHVVDTAIYRCTGQ